MSHETCNHNPRLVSVGLFAVLAILALPGPAWSTEYEPERTAWGSPDLQGVWDFRTLTPLERPPELADRAEFTAEEAEAFRKTTLELYDSDNRGDDRGIVDVERAYNAVWLDVGTELSEGLRTSLIVDPPDGRLPALTEAAVARRKEQNDLGTPPARDLFSSAKVLASPETFRPPDPESLGLSERCLVGFNAGPPLSPNVYNNNLRIVQTPDHVVLVTEMIHDARIVPIDGPAHLPADIRRWSGDSRGHWEGNTLVVDTTNFTDKTAAFQLPYNPENDPVEGPVGSGLHLHLTERFTPTGEDRLRYEYTIDDPTTFVQPFTVAITLRATDDRMYEFACHEGNYSAPAILRGARLLEKEESGS